jgi:hypothetical protein
MVSFWVLTGDFLGGFSDFVSWADLLKTLR